MEEDSKNGGQTLSAADPNAGAAERLPAKLLELLASASERPEDRPHKFKDLGDGRFLIWTQFQPEPGRFYPKFQRLIQQTVILVETADSLQAGTSAELLQDLGQWKAGDEGRFLVVYYPKAATPDRLCGLTPEATRLPAKDMIVEYDPALLA